MLSGSLPLPLTRLPVASVEVPLVCKKSVSGSHTLSTRPPPQFTYSPTYSRLMPLIIALSITPTNDSSKLRDDGGTLKRML
jgi:hypothetical protein